MVQLSKYFIESENIGIYEQIFENINIIDPHAHIGVDLDGHKISATELLKAMDRNGINRSIVFPMDDPQQGKTFTKPNDRIYRAFKSAPARFVPFFRLNPNHVWKAEFSHRVEQGFAGVKLHPRSQSFAISGESAMKLYDAMEKANLILLIHTGFGLDSVADELLTVAKTYPKLKIIVGHGAFPDLDKAIKVLANRDNVMLETSTMRVFDLLDLLKNFPHKQIAFGSDIPYYDQTLALQMLIDSATLAKKSPGKIRQMLGQNIEKLLS